MRVVFTVQAEQDLEEIGDYIAIDNPSRAVSFVREIREHCTEISSSPLGYTSRPDLGEGVRSCYHGRYLNSLSIQRYQRPNCASAARGA